jgi:hypothetical protein
MRNRIGGLGLVAGLLMVASGGPSCGGDGSSPDSPWTGGSTSSSGSSGGGNSSGGSGSGGSGSSGSGGVSDSGLARTDGSSGGNGDASQSRPDSAPGGCLGASQLAALGKSHLMIGVSPSDDATAAAAPFDLRYVYVSGGLSDGNAPCTSCASACSVGGQTCANSGGGCAWWGCYQSDANPPGEYARTFDSTGAAASPPQIPMFTYYEILQTATNTFTGFQGGQAEVTQAATSVSLMARYFADWRFLLQQIGQSVAILQIEPDFWGYAEQARSDPTALSAAVASANPTDCASMPNTIAGMGQCMVAMVRKYAPRALVGLSASEWATKVDVGLNASASLDVAAEARKAATFLAACGGSDADLVIVETSDRDAGYYQSAAGGMQNTWWDATNATLPNFHQSFAWVKALTEGLGKPALYWQTPLGNASQNDTTNHWKDNRVDYFFGHMSELAAAHVIGAAFGAGQGDQTTPETDGGNLIAKTKAYASGGGQALCP